MVYNPKTKKVTRVYSCTFEETLLGIRGHPLGSPPEIVRQIEGEPMSVILSPDGADRVHTRAR